MLATLPAQRGLAIAACVATSLAAGAVLPLVAPAAVPAGVGLALVYMVALVADQHARFALTFNVIVGLLLQDVFANAGLSAPWLILMSVQVVALALFGARPGRLTRTDVGIVMLAFATAMPFLVGGDISNLPGSLAFLFVMYLTGRFAPAGASLVPRLLVLVGAVHGAIGITQSVANLRGLVPFTPVIDGAPHVLDRATGLFNNPNTLGTVEAAVLVIAVLSGLPRRWWPLLALCVAGLVLSTSREALVAAVVGIAFVTLRQPGRAIRFVSIVAAMGVVVVALYPTVWARIDPSVYGSDVNFLGRQLQWGQAIELIRASPWIGYGVRIPVAVVDQAYLVWLLQGGAILLGLWIVSLLTSLPRKLWPLLATILVIGLLANPFAGAVFIVLLFLLGSNASATPRERVAGPAVAGAHSSRERAAAGA